MTTLQEYLNQKYPTSEAKEGVTEIEKKESVDLLSPWKEKGTNLVKDKVGSVSELKNKVDINKLTDLLNKKNKE